MDDSAVVWSEVADELRAEKRETLRELRRSRAVAASLGIFAVSLMWRGGVTAGFPLVVFGTVCVLALWAVGAWGMAELRAPARLRALTRELDLLEGSPGSPP